MTNSKPDLPWSIKGVTAEARARAKAAAKRDGVTMGAWLSQTIASGDGAAPAGTEAPVGAADIEARLDALEGAGGRFGGAAAEVIAQLSAAWRIWRTGSARRDGTQLAAGHSRQGVNHQAHRRALPRRRHFTGITTLTEAA